MNWDAIINRLSDLIYVTSYRAALDAKNGTPDTATLSRVLGVKVSLIDSVPPKDLAAEFREWSRHAGIRELADRWGMDADWVDKQIAAGTSVDAAEKEIAAAIAG